MTIRKRCGAAVVCILSLITAVFADPDENMHIYLLMGQSNMSGRAPYTTEEAAPIPRAYLLNTSNQWEPASNPLNRFSTIRKTTSAQLMNPGYTFTLDMLAHDPAVTIGLVVNARGNTSIQMWDKDNPDYNYYSEALRRTREAQKTGVLKGILWHQGEANAADPSYLPKLKKFIADLRADFGMPDLPFIAGQINDYPSFNVQIAALPGEVPNTGYAGSDGLTAMDLWHFDSPSMKLLGQRYAEALLNLGSTTPAVARPTISPDGGTIDSSLEVTLFCTTVGADIRYTTDGSTPTASSTLYTAKFILSATTTVKARAFKSGMSDSPVASASFTTSVQAVQAPYTGIAAVVPGRIEAEDFDLGGEGVAYHDLTAANQGGEYRLTEGVDVEAIPGGGYNLGFVGAGEWTEYTIDVAAAGNYALELRVANAGDGGQLHIEFDGANGTGTVTVPNTGAWTAFQTMTVSGISLDAGEQVMRISFDKASDAAGAGVVNLDWISLVNGTSVNKLLSRPGFERPDEGRMRVYDMQGRVMDAGKQLPRGIYLIEEPKTLHKVYLGD